MKTNTKGNENLMLENELQLERKGPRPHKLRKHILRLLGTRSKASIREIKNKMAGAFLSYPRYTIDSCVDNVISKLVDEGKLTISVDNSIVLTDKGRYGFNQIQIARQERREKKRTKKLAVGSRVKARLVHENIKDQLANLAALLGKTSKKEYRLGDKCPIRLDLVWYQIAGNSYPSHAFEVHHNGDLKNAVVNLVACRSHYPLCKLYLIICSEQVRMETKQLLGPTLSHSIQVINASELCSIPQTLSEIYKNISPSLYEELQTILRRLI